MSNASEERLGVAAWPIREVSKAESAFPASVSDWMPTYEDLPEDARRERGDYSDWVRLVDTWFFSGLPKGTAFEPREGVDARKALCHINYVMRSWEPRHEHKTAGCAWLLHMWFEGVTVPDSPALDGEVSA